MEKTIEENAVNPGLKAIHKMVMVIKADRKLQEEFMILQDKYFESYEEGKEEGKEEGRAEGLAEGRAEGRAEAGEAIAKMKKMEEEIALLREENARLRALREAEANR